MNAWHGGSMSISSKYEHLLFKDYSKTLFTWITEPSYLYVKQSLTGPRPKLIVQNISYLYTPVYGMVITGNVNRSVVGCITFVVK
jgi:hypothetical protein